MVFSGSPLNTDIQLIQTLWHVFLVSVLTGLHCMGVRIKRALRKNTVMDTCFIELKTYDKQISS